MSTLGTAYVFVKQGVVQLLLQTDLDGLEKIGLAVSYDADLAKQFCRENGFSLAIVGSVQNESLLSLASDARDRGAIGFWALVSRKKGTIGVNFVPF